MNTMEIRSLCIKNNWFTNGDNIQYGRLFDRINEGATPDEIATIIWICSTNTTKEEILKQIAPEKPSLNIGRIEMVKAMEMIARAVNDEGVFMDWLINGVADGDISENTDDTELEYYAEDDTFSDLMDTFLDLMSAAKKSGGLYFDNILSSKEY